MNYNVLTYLIYLPATAFITIRVGWMCYHYGEVFMKTVFSKEPELVKPVNQLLLTGYCLLNVGYAFWVLYSWDHIDSLGEMMASLFQRMSFIILGLGIMHYVNITSLIIAKTIKYRFINRFKTETKI